MALTPCIACRKDVEETLPICTYCGTLSPKRVMLIQCRVCGEQVGKNALRCPSCSSLNPYKKKFLREYLLIIPFLLGAYYLFSVGKPGSSNTFSTVSTLLAWFLIWFYFQKLKDYTGLKKLFPALFASEKKWWFPSCLKCKKRIFYKTETCPNCGEPVPKDV